MTLWNLFLFDLAQLRLPFWLGLACLGALLLGIIGYYQQRLLRLERGMRTEIRSLAQTINAMHQADRGVGQRLQAVERRLGMRVPVQRPAIEPAPCLPNRDSLLVDAAKAPLTQLAFGPAETRLFKKLSQAGAALQDVLLQRS